MHRNSLQEGDRDAVGCEGDSSGVGDVIKEILDGALSSSGVLCSKPYKCNHGQSSVGELVFLVLAEQRSIRQAERIKVATSGVSNSLALEVISDSKEGSVSLGSRVLDVPSSLGLHPVEHQELNPEKCSE